MTTDVVISGCGTVLDKEFVLPSFGPETVRYGTDDKHLKAFINKRGIRYKDRATRLALAASKLAMQNAAFIDDAYTDLQDNRFAVIACSDFGHVDTLTETITQIRAEGSETLSPMGLPNASANVVAATLAMWFGLRGPSLFLANGVAGGLDALQFAANLIDSDRADRVLVCAAEAEQPTLSKLLHRAGKSEPMNIGSALVIEKTTAFHERCPKRNVLSIQLQTVYRADNFDAFSVHAPETQQSLDVLPSWLEKAHSATGTVAVAELYQLMQQDDLAALRLDLDAQRPMSLTLTQVKPNA